MHDYLLPVYERGRMVEKAGTHLDTTAYIKDLDGFFARIEAKNKVELRKAIKKRLSL